VSDYDNLPPSKPAPRRAKNQAVFCVGWRAFVNWPQRNGRAVPLVDGEGRPLENDLIDGQEVEILSWRPKSREGAVYQVRRITDGSEWWIGVNYLRRQQHAPLPPAGSVSV
jgi:hypothetical protein